MNYGDLNGNINGFVCVYGIRCKVTRRIYIGSTSDLETRLKKHFKDLQLNRKKINVGKREYIPSVFQTDFNAFGIESFEVFVLEQKVPKDVRDEREEHWISVYNSTNPLYGYNLQKRCHQGLIDHEHKSIIPIHFGCPPIPNMGDEYER